MSSGDDDVPLLGLLKHPGSLVQRIVLAQIIGPPRGRIGPKGARKELHAPTHRGGMSPPPPEGEAKLKGPEGVS